MKNVKLMQELITLNRDFKLLRKQYKRNKLRRFLRIIRWNSFFIPAIIAIVFWPYLRVNSSYEVTKQSYTSTPESISKKDVQILLKNTSNFELTKNCFVTNFDNKPIKINTSLDMSLQKKLASKIDKINSRHVAIVVMNAENGKILAMIGFNKDNSDENPCIKANFPAASVFKIITAAAAIEKCGYSSNSILKFNGCKYTLYKNQIVHSTNRYTNKISLRNSFAQSVNPVFGKIGSFHLGSKYLRQYGNVFGFNKEITFELPWNVSNLSIEEDPYQWAEIASGFNRQTTISPLHGAVIASTIVNNGIPIEPTIINHVTDDNGNTIYSSQTKFLDRAITVDTANILSQLMSATVMSGTGRKAFEGCKNSYILSNLNIGGKTGTIYNKSHDTKFDWFVGFAKSKDVSKKIVVSVVVAHDKYAGRRASQYARLAIESYFKKFYDCTKKKLT